MKPLATTNVRASGSLQGEMVAGAGAGVERRWVLVAEDEDDIRELVVEILENAGYGVEAVSTGEAALLRLVEQDGFSLLLTDIRMPGAVDGWALADRAKACQPGLRVIYMTAFATVPPSHPGYGPLLPKPWTADQLLRCVRRVLDERASRVHLLRC